MPGTQHQKRFTGKTAIITGAGRGIGKAIAQRLSSEGAEVALIYGSSKDQAESLAAEINQAGGSAKAFHGNALQPDTMKELHDNVVDHFGKLDIVVNNAGILETGSVEDIDIEAFERTVNVNIRSVFTLTQAATKTLPEGGRIVNIGSCLGERAIFPHLSVYNMSKFAIAGLTRSWAWDLASRKITVNAVLPGPIATDMGNPDAAGMTALKRLGTAEEVASAVAFLASDEASYITGAQLSVDGGANA